MLKYFHFTLIVIYEQGENDGPGRGRGGGEAGGAGQDQCLRLRHVLPGTGSFTFLDFHQCHVWWLELHYHFHFPT